MTQPFERSRLPPFSVGRRLDRLPRQTARRFLLLCETLGKRQVLPVENAQIFTPSRSQVTYMSQRNIYQILGTRTVSQVEKIINDALPVSSRRTLWVPVACAEPLWSTDNNTLLFRGIGVGLLDQDVYLEMSSFQEPMRSIGRTLPSDYPTLSIAKFSPTPAERLATALDAINTALPEGTELPLMPVEFIPYQPAA